MKLPAQSIFSSDFRFSADKAGGSYDQGAPSTCGVPMISPGHLHLYLHLDIWYLSYEEPPVVQYFTELSRHTIS